MKCQIEIINKLGLHARASSKFTKLANTFDSEVWVSKKEKRINGKSIMGLMMLAATCGSIIEIETIGTDEKEALNALCELINNRFEESE